MTKRLPPALAGPLASRPPYRFSVGIRFGNAGPPLLPVRGINRGRQLRHISLLLGYRSARLPSCPPPRPRP